LSEAIRFPRRYPGLKSFPQKALADKQHRDGMHGGMLWFEVKVRTRNGPQNEKVVTRLP
jgi:cystathionine beta-lyase/cystathionine gamma-synthase